MKENKNMKKYELSKMEKLILWLENCEYGDYFYESIKWAKFQSINECIDKFVTMHEENEDKSDYHFTLTLDHAEEEALKQYLLKNKDFVIEYIVSTGYTLGTHLHQLYLQYIPDKLNDVEKGVFLNGYIRMLEDLHGESYSFQRRHHLEQKLHLIND